MFSIRPLLFPPPRILLLALSPTPVPTGSPICLVTCRSPQRPPLFRLLKSSGKTVPRTSAPLPPRWHLRGSPPSPSQVGPSLLSPSRLACLLARPRQAGCGSASPARSPGTTVALSQASQTRSRMIFLMGSRRLVSRQSTTVLDGQPINPSMTRRFECIEGRFPNMSAVVLVMSSRHVWRVVMFLLPLGLGSDGSAR